MSISSFRMAALGSMACLTAGKAPPADFSPSHPPQASGSPANGAIFQASAGYAALTGGARASAVGDMLTVVLVERTQATKSATQGTDRSGTFGLTPPSTGPFALFGASDVNMGGAQSFKGSGQAAQSNALTGEITVTIAAAYSNGTLLADSTGRRNTTEIGGCDGHSEARGRSMWATAIAITWAPLCCRPQ